MASPSDEPLVIEVDPPDLDEGEAQAASPRRRLGVGAAIVLVLAALAVTVGIGVVRTGGGAAASTASVASGAPTRAAAAPTTTAAERVYVDVVGAVKHPGMFVLPAGARVLDAVSAAGGFAAKAQRDAVNLARPLADGEQLIVPKQGASASAPGTTSAAPAGASAASGAPGGKIDLNTATQEQLESLPRIGPALSQRILDWRQQNGRFTSVDDLLAVPGIGDKMLASLRDLVTV